MSPRFGSGWLVIYFLICSCTFICSVPPVARTRLYDVESLLWQPRRGVVSCATPEPSMPWKWRPHRSVVGTSRPSPDKRANRRSGVLAPNISDCAAYQDLPTVFGKEPDSRAPGMINARTEN